MEDFLREFEAVVTQATTQLSSLSEEEAQQKPASGEGEWSRKQILGHLLDSAFNNHQRFVRVQLQTKLVALPGYDQPGWVEASHYQELEWERLVELWHSLNTHLAHLVKFIPADKLQNLCTIDGSEPLTLQFVIEDYLVHLKGHLAELLPEV